MYRHPTTLTSEEYQHANKHFFRYTYGQKPCRNYNVVDVTKKTMFRRPLPACKHKPLNNLMIHQALKKHCKDYHDDGNNYIFHYKTDETWKEIHYPPQSTNKKIENPMTQQYKIQKGQKFYHNSDVNSKNSYECKGKNPLTTLPNNSYNQNNYKGKNPFPTFSNNSYNNNHHKGKSPYTNEPNDTAYDKNNHKGKNPFRETKPEDELGKKEDDTTSSSTPPNSPPEQITPEPLPFSET